MRVEELMSSPVSTCLEDDSLATAAKLMHTRCCGVIPVIAPTGVILGMVTDRDICMAAQKTGRRLEDIGVEEVIGETVFSVKATDTIRHAEEVMRVQRVRRLPVVDGNSRVIGLLSLNDIAREGQREVWRRAKHRHINSAEVLHTLAAICEPVDRDTPPIR